MKRLAYILPLMILALLSYAWLSPSQMPANGVYVDVPSTPSYPVCVTEDGAGQALCTWDAQTQGNGQGTSIISGDCAPAIMGQAASDVCVVLHSEDSHTVDMGNGFSQTMPNGADLVAECIDENRLMSNSDKAQNGFTLEHCFKAQMGQ